jgi:2-methylisocitrate lyase-like PEP mutase family enzyme
MTTVRDRFRALHSREGIFVMPNPWDVGSARLMAHAGFEALATSSAGLAWSLGKHDGEVDRPELVAHVAAVAASVDLPLNVDSEHCFPDQPGGVAETVRLLAEAGAAGCSIEDWNPFADRIEPVDLSVERVRQAVEAAHALPDPLVVTARAENHLHDVHDLDDTIARVLAYRDAGADCVFTPGLVDLDQIERVVREVGIPVNVVHFPGVPAVGNLERVGVKRVSTGSCPARAAYAAMLDGLAELREHGTSAYGAGPSFRAVVGDALA